MLCDYQDNSRWPGRGYRLTRLTQSELSGRPVTHSLVYTDRIQIETRLNKGERTGVHLKWSAGGVSESVPLLVICIQLVAVAMLLILSLK